MYYANGYDFEEAIFKRSSLGLYDPSKSNIPTFSDGVRSVLEKGMTPHPETRIGGSLHLQTTKVLEKYGINPEGLVFLSSMGEKIDRFYQTDGVIFLPSLYPHLVTVDAFNLCPEVLFRLRDFWIDTWVETPEDPAYSDKQFQSDLFRLKAGMSAYMKENKCTHISPSMLELVDFRRYSNKNRPENHFILTPYYAHRGMKYFVRMIAGYFLKVSREQKGKGEKDHI